MVSNKKRFLILLSASIFFLAILFEFVILCFTDNYMYAKDGVTIVRQIVPNVFRILTIWLTLSVFFHNRYFLLRKAQEIKNQSQKYIRKAGIIAVCLIIWTIVFCLFVKVIADFNRFYIIIGVASGITCISLYAYRKGYIKNIETLYLIVSTTLIVCLILVYPGVPYGGDSEIHLRSSLMMSQAYDENQWPVYASLVDGNEGKLCIADIIRLESISDEKVIHSYKRISAKLMQSPRDIGYLPYSVGLVIADAFNLKTHVAFRLAEIINGCFICLIFYLSIKQLKSRKLVLIMFAMLPYVVMVSSRFSYTPWVFAWLTYGSSCLIGFLQDSRELERKDLFTIYVAYLLGCLPKQPYFFIVLLPLLLIPKEKIGCYKRMNILLALGVAGILVFTLLFPIVLQGFGFYTDDRGGSDVNAKSQLIFILTHPLSYAKILFRHIYDILSAESFAYGRNGYTSLGTPMNVLMGRTVIFKEVISIAIFASLFLDNESNSDYQWAGRKNKIIILLVTIIGMCVLSTILYICYTPVGLNTINGVNPLYYITFMIPLFCIMTSNKFSVRINRRKMNTVFLSIVPVIMYVTICLKIIRVYQF